MNVSEDDRLRDPAVVKWRTVNIYDLGKPYHPSKDLSESENSNWLEEMEIAWDSGSTNQTLTHDPDPKKISWSFQRLEGDWLPVGRFASRNRFGDEPWEIFLKKLPPQSLFPTPTAGLRWRQASSKVSNLIDLVSAAGSPFCVLVSDEFVEVMNLRNGSISRSSGRIPSNKESVVMTEWYFGDNVDKVADEVTNR